MAPARPASLLALLGAAIPLLLAACTAPCDYGAGDVVPVSLRSSLPVVPVEVNGSRVPFVLDTGAARTALMAEGAAVLRLQMDRLRSTGGMGIAGRTQEQNAMLARMRVGQHDLRNLTLPVVRFSRPGQRIAAGLLGADFLQVAEVELDIPARRVTLHDRRACRVMALPWQGAYDSIPIQLVGGGLMILPAEVNGRPVRALFDTGSGGTVIRRSIAPAIGLPEEALAQLPAIRADGIGTEARQGRIHRGATMRVGGETITGATLVFLDLPSDAPFELILGQDYIGARRFWISYAERMLHVQKAAPPAAP